MSAILGQTSITFGDGTQQFTAALPYNGQVFSSSGTFTIPAGVTAVKVICVGGGGTAGFGGIYCCCGTTFFAYGGGNGGGGSGAISISYFYNLTPGKTLTVTVGSAGIFGNSQQNGGTSSVSSGTQSITTLTAGGGSANSGDTGGSGGSASGGNYLNRNGIQGQGRIYGGSGTYSQGYGGSSTYNGFGVGGYVSSSGGPGVVIIEW